MEQSHCHRVVAITSRLLSLGVAIIVTFALSTPDAFAQDTKVKKGDTFTVLPTVITGVAVVDGALVASGLVGTTPFSAPITLTAGELVANATCPILNLELGPIHLNLLGLNVDTSRICLDITAIPGGGLLGDLLCAIANLLSGGSALTDILAGLTSQQLSTLTNGLTQALNQAVFIPISQSDALQAASCDVLNLALGPIDLNLLGLRVELDNCANGPVTVDVTAVPGGGLLGDLLCSLADGPLNNLNARVLAILQAIAVLLGSILG